MTASSLHPRVDFASRDEAVEVIRRAGLRMSTARRIVLDALFGADEPITAEAIASGLGGRAPRLELASVYRNLEALEHIGLVQHVHLGHGAGRYLLARGAECEYVLCEACGEAHALDPGELEPVRAAVRTITGLEARFSHFPIVGVCAKCRGDGHAHP